MPKVLPSLNSNAPAKTCMSPPNASASGITTGSPPAGSTPALTRLNSTVVSPNATSPSAAGLATGTTTTSCSAISLPLLLFGQLFRLLRPTSQRWRGFAQHQHHRQHANSNHRNHDAGSSGPAGALDQPLRGIRGQAAEDRGCHGRPEREAGDPTFAGELLGGGDGADSADRAGEKGEGH